jgi:predicted dehydrogenase
LAGRVRASFLKQMYKLSIGVIGCGGIAQDVHLPILRKLDQFSLKWVCDLDPARAKTCAQQFGIPHWFQALEHCSDVDAVLVATPVGSRKKILGIAAHRGWHAFCEKPFAANCADHQTILAQAEAKNLILACGYMRRFYHSTIAARDLFRCLSDNSEVEVVASDCQRIRRNPHSASWYLTDAGASGGGFLMETGSHLIDQALTIIGVPDIEITAARQIKIDAVEYETTAVGNATLYHVRPIQFSLAVSRLRDLWTGIRISSHKLHMEISLHPGAPVVITNSETGAQSRIPTPLSSDNDLTNAYVSQLTAFADRVRMRDSISNMRETGLRTTAFLSQCYERSVSKQMTEMVYQGDL